MADMTIKHHNLIYDAIYEAGDLYLQGPAFQKLAKGLKENGDTRNLFQLRTCFETQINMLANVFSTKLRYTNDKFQASVWRNQVQAIASELWDKNIVFAKSSEK